MNFLIILIENKAWYEKIHSKDELEEILERSENQETYSPASPSDKMNA